MFWYLDDIPPSNLTDPLMWKKDYTEKLILRNVFLPELMDDIVSYAREVAKLERANLAQQTSYTEIRKSSISFFDDYQHPFLERLYPNIVDLVEYANNLKYKYHITSLEPLQYTEYYDYEQGRFNWHQDESMSRKHDDNIRKLSFSILLSNPEEVEGGEFQIKEDVNEISLDLRKGDVVFFPSCVYHRVTPVTRGTRMSLVGWVRGPNWK